MKTKIFKNNDELKALIKKSINGDEYIDFEGYNVICEFDIDFGTNSISLINIRDFKTWNFRTCGNIKVRQIEAKNLYAHNIEADYIDAWDITAQSIKCKCIESKGSILYFAFCFAYENITCNSIRGHWKNSKHFCLDGEITINK